MRHTYISMIFQSTLPARGATKTACFGQIVDNNFNPRSPHGERLVIHTTQVGVIEHFNPRSPHGERLRKDTGNNDDYFISIHAPRTGSDLVLALVLALLSISIHAPRTGSDSRSWSAIQAYPNFNPRSPHGERPS